MKKLIAITLIAAIPAFASIGMQDKPKKEEKKCPHDCPACKLYETFKAKKSSPSVEKLNQDRFAGK